MSLGTDALKEYVPLTPMERIKQFPSTRGVYVICNTINLKRYIGSSVDIKGRLLTHYNDLLKNKHHNKHLQSAVNKYGIENFYPSVLDHYSEYPLHEVEMNLIDGLKTFSRNFGYNIAVPGKPPSLKGVPKTQSHNIKNSLAKKGCLNPNYGKRPNQVAIDKLIQFNISTRKEYVFISPSNEVVRFKGLAEFCKANNLNQSNMCLVAQGKQNKHKGWTLYPKRLFEYNYKRKLSDSQINQIIELYSNKAKNQKELAIMFGVYPGAIRNVLIKSKIIK